MAENKPYGDVITIRLFGTPQARYRNQLVHIRRLKSRALLYYLAARAEATSRGRLLALFWPDMDPSSARRNLRSTLYHLRQTVGEAVCVENDRLSLSPLVEVDVRTFAAELSHGQADITRLSAALELYGGDFLAGFTSPDMPAFEDWVAAERERLRRLAVKGLVALSDLHEAAGDLTAALEALEHALSFDPLQEDLQRACLRLHHLSGDRTGAIRRYERFRRLLDAEMGVPPMPETRAIYDAIVNDDYRDVPSGAISQTLSAAPPQPGRPPGKIGARPALVESSLPFVGRHSELNRLHASADPGVLVLVEGPPGIGKTRLVEAFIERAESSDVSVLSLFGRARELERNLPYQPVIEALRNVSDHPSWPELRSGLTLPAIWQAEMTRLLPEWSPPSATPLPLYQLADESRLWEGVHQFLGALAGRRSLIFTVDDLHWADASTLGLLGYLVRRTGQHTLFLATSRGDEMAGKGADITPFKTLLNSLLREHRLERIRLNRLSEEDVFVLARQLAGHDADHFGAWLLQGSEGNPFILAELVRHARDYQILGPSGLLEPGALPAAPVVPRTVHTIIRSRLERLSASARRVLDAAAVVGREFDYEVAARVAALSDRAAIDALEEAQAGRLIEPLDASRFTFDQNLTMAVILQETTAARRRLLHRHTAEALENIHGDNPDLVAGTIALHYERAGLPEKSARYAFLAGQRAAKLAAWKEAAGFFEQALKGIEGSKRQKVLLALGQAYLQEGRIGRATASLRDALAVAQKQADTNVENMAMQLLAESLLMQDYYEDVIELAREIIELDRAEMSAIGYALLGAALSQESVNLAAAAKHLRRAESDLRKRSDEQSLELLAEVKFELGNVFAKQGDLKRAVEQYRAVLQLVRIPKAETAWRWHILAHNNLAFHLHLLGDPEAQETIQVGLAIARERGAITLLPFLLSTAGEIALAQGDLPTAESYFREGLDLAEQFSRPERIVGLMANMGLVARDRGQKEVAVDRLRVALAKAGEIQNHYQGTQIRLWLAPLLPENQGLSLLQEARAMAEKGGYGRLLDLASGFTL